MGITRKMISASTVGIVDFRSDKERIARSTRQSAKQLKKQTKLMRNGNRVTVGTLIASAMDNAADRRAQLAEQDQAYRIARINADPTTPVQPAAGWYADPYAQFTWRYWDGNAWTTYTR